MNASAGFSITPGNNFSLTIDGYYIKVNNRITLTGNFGQDVYGSPDSLIQSYLLPFNAEAARFLTNSVDTRTMGLDVVALYHWYINTNNNIDFTLAANMNDIMVTEVNPIPEKLQSQPDIYFSPAEQGLIETVNPKQKLNFSIQYHHNKFSALLRNEYFGSVARNAFPFGTVQTFGGKLVTDLSLSYDFNKIISASIGANNLFNAYPDEQVYPNSYFGVFKYAPVQMGTTGTFYFLKIFLRIGNQ